MPLEAPTFSSFDFSPRYFCYYCLHYLWRPLALFPGSLRKREIGLFSHSSLNLPNVPNAILEHAYKPEAWEILLSPILVPWLKPSRALQHSWMTPSCGSKTALLAFPQRPSPPSFPPTLYVCSLPSLLCCVCAPSGTVSVPRAVAIHFSWPPQHLAPCQAQGRCSLNVC